MPSSARSAVWPRPNAVEHQAHSAAAGIWSYEIVVVVMNEAVLSKTGAVRARPGRAGGAGRDLSRRRG